MQAYRQAMVKENTSIILSPQSEFLQQMQGRR